MVEEVQEYGFDNNFGSANSGYLHRYVEYILLFKILGKL